MMPMTSAASATVKSRTWPSPIMPNWPRAPFFLYVDTFGNVQLNLTREHLERVGVEPGTTVELVVGTDRYYAVTARTFADTRPGDLLLYEDLVLRTPSLTLPHPGLLSRRFVLAPLAELCPDRIVPGTGATVAELLRSAPPNDMSSAGLYPG